MTRTLKQTIRSGALAALAFAMLSPASAFAQLNGDHILGDNGVDSASQPPPGFYFGGLFYRYHSDTIRNADGTRLVIDPANPASISIPLGAPTLLYVTKLKIFGGNYGLMLAPVVASNTLEAPAFGFHRSSGTAMSDTYVQPLMIGWHHTRADFSTAFGLYAPTGRYTAGGSDNTGHGMWGYEGSGGATVYLDAAKQWSAATTGYFETHGKKAGTTVDLDRIALGGVKVGDIITLEGGVGRLFAKGSAHAGLAYYAQRKVTDDDFGVPVTPPNGPILSRHRVYGLGPDVTVPIATKDLLIAFVNVRYFWELGAEVKTQGQSLILSATFPVPAVKISKTN